MNKRAQRCSSMMRSVVLFLCYLSRTGYSCAPGEFGFNDQIAEGVMSNKVKPQHL